MKESVAMNSGNNRNYGRMVGRRLGAQPRRGSGGRLCGFSLIELMIALTIGIFMLLALQGVLISSSSNRKTNDRTSELQTNGRYALDYLKRELQHAGYQGNTWAEPTAPTGLGTITNECAAGSAANLRQGIWGTNDANPFSAVVSGSACIPTSAYSTGTDVLVMRRASFTPVASSALAANTLYVRSAYERLQVFNGATGPVFTEVPNADFRLENSVFYISPFTVSAGERPLVPALWRSFLTTGPAMRAELVASGIQDLQIEYGRFTTDGNIQYFTANNVDAAATSATTAATGWDDVKAVRLWLLVRNSTPEQGYSNTSTYNLGTRTVTVNDSFRRQVFSSVVTLRNN